MIIHSLVLILSCSLSSMTENMKRYESYPTLVNGAKVALVALVTYVFLPNMLKEIKEKKEKILKDEK